MAITLTVVAAVSSLAAGPAAAQPAAAALPAFPAGIGCWIVTTNGIPVGDRCVDLTQPKVVPLCRVCPAIGFDRRVDALPVDRRLLVIRGVADGLVLLAEADLATDPTRVRALRLAALTAFTTVAAQFDGGPVMVGTTGVLDRGRNRFVPSSIGWLAAADAQLAAGLVGAQDPDGDPIDALLGPFDQAMVAIRAGRPTGA